VQRLYQGRHSSENESVLVLSLLRSEQATIDRRCSGSSSAQGWTNTGNHEASIHERSI
ncbi:hypothetical protein HID58_007893, partial [Brassica napus]